MHIDIDAKGGFAKIIEDSSKFGRYGTLMTIAEGPLGLVMFSIKNYLSRYLVLAQVNILNLTLINSLNEQIQTRSGS